MIVLPIDELIPSIVASLEWRPNAVVVAPPGAGKTTRIPPALLDAQFLKQNESVVLLQPRRVAARAAAARIAEERGWKLGDAVGYQIRFENRTTPRTRVRVITEGILTRRILADPYLEGIGCVILDEFHERSIHTDLALAMLREIQSSVRSDLRVVVMSATMNPKPVAEFLGTANRDDPAPIFESAGRLFPIEIAHLPKPPDGIIWDHASKTIAELLPSAMTETGHILAFFPGMGEIRRVEKWASEIAKKTNTDIHILHGSVSSEDQDRALRPSQRRKLILATNIAETSITIDGVRTVVDSSYARVMVADAMTGIDRLELRRISRASADQRAGRAGRTAPGRCFRLWSKAEDAALAPSDIPEIHRLDLAGTLLALRAFGMRDPAKFAWFDPPRPERIARDEKLLFMLSAVDSRGAITDLGKKMSQLPLHPRLARLLLAGKEQGLLREAATLAAMLSERDALPIQSNRKSSSRRNSTPIASADTPAGSAPTDLIALMELMEKNPRSAAFDPIAVAKIHRVRNELIRAMKGE